MLLLEPHHGGSGAELLAHRKVVFGLDIRSEEVATLHVNSSIQLVARADPIRYVLSQPLLAGQLGK